MANRLCPLCGASYVDWAASCSDCGVALIDPDSTEDPRTLAEDEQLVYELASWSLDQRTEVAQVMAESGIPHAWDDDELYVHLRFESAVDDVVRTATARAGEDAGRRIGTAFARGLQHLMAYKDEYEVARLHLDPAEQARIRAEFGPDAEVSVLLHPPALRALGMGRKIRLRRTATPVFRALVAGRRLRGTRLDLFGYAGVRRTERALVGEYEGLVRQAVERLTPQTADDVERLAVLVEEVRGYEEIKLANVERFREQARAALAALDVPVPAAPVTPR